MPTNYNQMFTGTGNPRRSGRYPWGSLYLRLKAEIKDVIFNNPATIILWNDDTKTVVKCGEGEVYDPEKGLAMAIAKRFLGNQGNYYDTFKKWLPVKGVGIKETKTVNDYVSVTEDVINENMKAKQLVTLKRYAEMTGQPESSVRADIKAGMIPGAKKVNGKWQIPW